MRPIGHRVIEVMEALEKRGPSSYSQVMHSIGETCHQHTYKYCQRAVGLGLASVEGSKPRIYTPLPGWRDKATRRKYGKPEHNFTAPSICAHNPFGL